MITAVVWRCRALPLNATFLYSLQGCHECKFSKQADMLQDEKGSPQMAVSEPACAAAGKYKWIVYGDDDTVMFIDNILHTLNTGSGLDWRKPYLLSDCIWWPEGTFGEILRLSWHLASQLAVACPMCCAGPPQDMTQLLSGTSAISTRLQPHCRRCASGLRPRHASHHMAPGEQQLNQALPRGTSTVGTTSEITHASWMLHKRT